ncbi:signal peptidase I [Cellulomonas alba]|uniref:Signal peptidase I n=1 Tax=Cellulomonas alba TaxID=3053467 RepID=A0ABT7SGW4_9CELL|nr:signal peptidase I [Cellulomonas alba]MDM7855416.1 signal peptidase I [Cellulomonas alba]
MDDVTHHEHTPTAAAAEPPVGVLTDLRAAASRMVLAAVVGLLFWAVACALVGMKVTTIRSGSMEPSIMTGDVVAASHLDFADVEPGQVVTVHNPVDAGGYLTHRVNAVDPEGRLVTKGDANASTDSTHVPAGDVWLGRLRVPWVGYPVVWARHHDWVALSLATVGLALVVRGSIATPILRSFGDADDGDGSARRSKPRRRQQVAVAAVAGGVLVTLVALQVNGSSAAAFTSQSRTATSTWSAATAPSLGPYGSAVMASKPYLWFRMNEPACTFVDSSGNGNNDFLVGTADCTVGGALPTQVQNDLGTAFLGTSALASDRTYPSLNAMTFEAFVRFTDSAQESGNSTVAEFVSPSGWRDRLYISYSSVVYQASASTGTNYLQGNVHGDSQWHYMAVSMSGSTVDIRVDGFTWHSDSVSRAADSIGRFVIGTHSPPYSNTHALGTENFKGAMDEIALYTRALTPAELQAHYQASLK